MPPNLGGFFMVRSYYPSECHADYFDFERRSEERFSRNAETDLVCRLLLEKKKRTRRTKARRTTSLCTALLWCIRHRSTGIISSSFFFHDTRPPRIYTLSLHDALPIYNRQD